MQETLEEVVKEEEIWKDRKNAEGVVSEPHAFREFWSYFSKNTGAVVGFYVILLLLFVSIFADFIAPHSYSQQYREYFSVPPFWQEGGSLKFILGTDDVGRDILSRIIYGIRLSLFIGLIVVTLSVSVGVILGLIAGFARGFVEMVIMRLMDIMMAIPSLLLAIVIVAILEPSLTNAMIAVAVAAIPHYVRLTRAAVITEKSKEYVIASKISGAGVLRQMFINVLPNCMAPLIVQATLGFSAAILDAAALGFLGLGAKPPTPELGTMLANARQFITSAWWIVAVPGVSILVTVLAFNLLGDGLRDALDPKLKR